MEQTVYDFLYKYDLTQSVSRTILPDLQLLDLHRKLIKAFPHLYQDWVIRFPFDQDLHAGLELTLSFQKSRPVDGPEIFKSFLNFCQNFWHLVTDQEPHLFREDPADISMFHIHYYEASNQRIRGPHLQDMVTEVLKAKDLNEKMPLLLLIATSDRPIFVHSVTGDDLYDHSYGAVWLGNSLPLDFSKLD